MKFSIITPSFNQGKYIKDTLDSVLNLQPDCSLEHIVVDGNSSDQTVEILKKYSKDHKNLIWESSPDKGQSDALNKGLKQVTGDIIAYINSDDYYLPDTFIKVENWFESYPQVDFVYGDIFLVDSQKVAFRRVESIRTSLWKHLYSYGFPQQSCFWRKRILDKIPKFNIQNKTCMDSEYFAHLLKEKITFFRTSEPIACFRIHENSITGSGKMLAEYKQDRQRLVKEFSCYPFVSPILNLTGRAIKQIDTLKRSKSEIFTP